MNRLPLILRTWVLLLGCFPFYAYSDSTVTIQAQLEDVFSQPYPLGQHFDNIQTAIEPSLFTPNALKHYLDSANITGNWVDEHAMKPSLTVLSCTRLSDKSESSSEIWSVEALLTLSNAYATIFRKQSFDVTLKAIDAQHNTLFPYIISSVTLIKTEVAMIDHKKTRSSSCPISSKIS